MRFSERNRQPVWYSTFVSKTEIVDEYENATGEYKMISAGGVRRTIKEDGTTDTAHNYRVVGIRPSLNTVKFYAQKVSVTQVVEQEPIEPEEPEGPGRTD